ncbi:hypothetical protein LPTSP3_g06810 [Leptospira kobayashii]|uniref:ATP-grasp domain protein n=2 Tax=Leptospira kobayashii TaxID=1917830 RepID=A0ABN6KDM7_9LEPT|nr:hypothetical protein LPTSP3_g06810 [Leptospira kobayashii]
MGTQVLKGDLLSGDLNLTEWGKMHVLSDGGLDFDPDSYEDSRYLNSKLNQFQWKEDTCLSPLWSRIIRSEETLIDFLNELDSPVVLKSAFGLAGRNQIVIEKQSQGWKLQQISKKLFSFPIIAEQWVGEERFYDFSTLWDFLEDGPIYLGCTEMIVEKDGTFRGIRMGRGVEESLLPFLEPSLQTIKTVSGLLEVKPTGPAAMDGFLYRTGNGLVSCQPFSEINFRYSMGRILYEIRKRRNLKDEESVLLFLPLANLKKWSEWEWLSKLRNETGREIFFATPPRDEKGKLFQTVGLYFESKKSLDYDASATFQKVMEEWQNLF